MITVRREPPFPVLLVGWGIVHGRVTGIARDPLIKEVSCWHKAVFAIERLGVERSPSNYHPHRLPSTYAAHVGTVEHGTYSLLLATVAIVDAEKATPDYETPVLVVGAGPAGLIAALQLSRNGTRCMLVERNLTTTKWPKMDITNCRSMELLKRLGIDQGLREIGESFEATCDKYANHGTLHIGTLEVDRG